MDGIRDKKELNESKNTINDCSFSKYKENDNLILSHNYDCIKNIFVLKDGRLTSCFLDGEIIIYNKTNYSIDLTICLKIILGYHSQLKNGYIIACSFEGIIVIIELLKNNRYQFIQKLYKKCFDFHKIIEMNNLNLISITEHGIFNIWEKYNIAKYIKYKWVKSFQDNLYNLEVILIDGYKLLYSDKNNKTIKIINGNDFSLITKFKNISSNNICYDKNKKLIFLLNCYSVLIINSKNFKMINIKFEFNSHLKKKIISLSNGNILVGEKAKRAYNYLKIKDKFYLITNNNYIYSIIEYKYNLKEKSFKKINDYNNFFIKIKDKNIVGLVEINNNTIAYAYDKNIYIIKNYFN